jgi:hypothetical protein
VNGIAYVIGILSLRLLGDASSRRPCRRPVPEHGKEVSFSQVFPSK